MDKTFLYKIVSRHGRQASIYATIGITALCLELTLFYFAIEKMSAGIVYANILAVGTGMMVSFTLNAVLNFKVSDNLLSRAITYTAVVAMGYLLSTSLIILLNALGINAFVAKLLSLPFVFLLQYGLNYRFTFNTK